MNLDDFECVQCGNCCNIPGYVRVADDEINKIAKFLQLEVNDFIEKYTILTDDRRSLSLIEKDDDSCIFYNSQTGCLINDLKPEQCKSFPYTWRYSNLSEICKGAEQII